MHSTVLKLSSITFFDHETSHKVFSLVCPPGPTATRRESMGRVHLLQVKHLLWYTLTTNLTGEASLMVHLNNKSYR